MKPQAVLMVLSIFFWKSISLVILPFVRCVKLTQYPMDDRHQMGQYDVRKYV